MFIIYVSHIAGVDYMHMDLKYNYVSIYINVLNNFTN